MRDVSLMIGYFPSSAHKHRSAGHQRIQSFGSPLSLDDTTTVASVQTDATQLQKSDSPAPLPDTGKPTSNGFQAIEKMLQTSLKIDAEQARPPLRSKKPLSGVRDLRSNGSGLQFRA